ncbi:hypothetical protein [Rhizobium sp. Root483D2]|uniref:hypothetical protein n=1 Tax=Rhizobium sp. Root483D2 TaxID=1736545 RepID=UPI000713CD03|nr:hypothetical protein [Rhizobium sp. Root483D2]KQY31785.1 hypothetical protein ASD32_04105 [Rhizobium sp. Root483D2]
MDSNHFTPFGARVTHPPVIVLPRRPSRRYCAFAVASPLLWAAALILIGHLAFSSGRALVALDRQIAMAERV